MVKVADREELLSAIIDRALRRASKLGCSEAEAYAVWTKTVDIDLSNNRVTRTVSRDIGGLGVRVAVGRKLGSYGTHELALDRIDEVVDVSYRIAKAAPEDRFWRRFSRNYGRSSVEGTYDKSFSRLEPGEIVEFTKGLVEKAIDTAKGMGAGEVSVTRGMVSLREELVMISNSYGDTISGPLSSLTVYMQIKSVVEKGESTYMVFHQLRRYDKEEFLKKTAEAAELSTMFAGAKPIPSGEYQLLLTPTSHAEFTSIALAPAFSALSVQQGRSPLANKIGDKVLSEHVTILDDPWMPWSPGAREFDDEGIATSRKPLIENGVLRTYVYDTYTALRENRESTGNGLRRSLSAAPAPAILNLYMKPGDIDIDDMIRDIRKGLMVYATIGYWMSNPVNGNISGTVTHGFYIENGEIKHPVKGVVLSGNIYRILGPGLEGIGKKVENVGNIFVPAILARGIRIAGK